MAFPGGMPGSIPPGLPGTNDTAGMSDQERQMVKLMQSSMESCAGKTVMAGIMGGGLGAMFGLFMSSMRYDTPLSSPLNPSSSTIPGSGSTTPQPITDLPLRQQLRLGLRDMYKSSLSSGRNFALVGGIFSGVECGIEGFRAKNDIYNGVAAGCITGGVLARNAGPQAAAVGCVGFAAFSAAIDAYMRMPEDEKSRPVA